MNFFSSKFVQDETKILNPLQNLTKEIPQYTTFQWVLSVLGVYTQENVEIAKLMDKKCGKNINLLYLLSDSDWKSLNLPLGPERLLRKALNYQVKCTDINLKEVEVLLTSGQTKKSQEIYHFIEQKNYKNIKIQCIFNYPSNEPSNIEVKCLNLKGQTLFYSIKQLLNISETVKEAYIDLEFEKLSKVTCQLIFSCHGTIIQSPKLHTAKKQHIEKCFKRLKEEFQFQEDFKVRGIYPNHGPFTGGESIYLYIDGIPKINHNNRYYIDIDGHKISQNEIYFVQNTNGIRYPECKYRVCFESPRHNIGWVDVKMNNVEYNLGNEKYEYRDHDEELFTFDTCLDELRSGKRERE